MTGVQNIIFDFGGVFLDLDEKKTYDAFRKLGFETISPQIALANTAIQRGDITPAEFREVFRVDSGVGFSDSQIDDAWCAMLGGIAQQRIEFLRGIKKKYRIFLLSNTDDIHIGYIERHVANFGEFVSHFERVYYSQKCGLRKPEKALYEKVLTENSLRAQDCLFVDDLKSNTEAAESLGIRSWWLDLSVHTVLDLKKILPD